MFLLVMPKYQGGKNSALVVSPKWVKSNERREREERKKKEQKSVLIMVSIMPEPKCNNTSLQILRYRDVWQVCSQK